MNLAIASHFDPPVGLDQISGFARISRKTATKELSVQLGMIFDGLAELKSVCVRQAISTKESKEFIALRDRVFRRYARLSDSHASLIGDLLDRQAIEIAIYQSISETESEFREHAVANFGEAVKEQGMFTVWTMRRTSGLIAKIAAAGSVSKDKEEFDRELAGKFRANSIWANFHIDCLIMAIETGTSIPPGIMEEIQEGLKAAVSAYGIAREGLLLREMNRNEPAPTLEWDEEDQELLTSSMMDMEIEKL